MSIVLISESHIGLHKINNPKIKLFSTQGSKVLRLTGSGYKLNEIFLKKIIKENPRFVLIGTDLDLQGTKIGSIIHYSLKSFGIKSFRFALTEKGYMRIGEFFSRGKLLSIFQTEWHNINFAKKIKSVYGVSIGRRSFIILGASYYHKLNTKKVQNLNPQGSNTITAITKGLFKGRSVFSTTSYLQNLYKKGKIPYPRVDNDYIQDKPYDLYPHPNLREWGYGGDLVKPLEEEEYPFSYKTLWLQLNNERLITPATVNYYDLQLKKIYWNVETLNPKSEFKPLLYSALKYYEMVREEVKKEIENIYNPQLKLSKPIPIGYLNKSEKELEELFEKIEEELKSRREREEESIDKSMDLLQQLRKKEEEFIEDLKRKRKRKL